MIKNGFQNFIAGILIYLFMSAIFQDVSAQPLRSPRPDPDTTLTIQDLLYPSFEHPDLNSRIERPANPFLQQKKVPVPLLFNLGSAIIKSTVEEPFNLPNYGLGLPPSVKDISPKNITDYELILRRINRY